MSRYFVAVIALLLLGTVAAAYNPVELVAHPSGKAVFIPGNACVVNADETVSPEEYQGMVQWCAKFHLGRDKKAR